VTDAPAGSAAPAAGRAGGGARPGPLDVPAALAAATAELAAAGVPSPAYDAAEIAAHVLGIRRATLAVAPPMTGPQAGRYADLVGQRAARVPLQHLTGIAGFRYLDLAVGPGVFVPRPETELLAGWAVERARECPAPTVVDLCAGSGAIALAVGYEVPAARVWAVELDPDALAWAERNVAARAAAGDTPVTLLRGDAADPGLLADLAGTVDVLTANPPYIPDGSTVDREVAEHDPPAALWGGPDGLRVVRAVERAAARLLRPGGRLGIEHADQQGAAVPAVLTRTGAWTAVEDHPDLNNRPRYTTAVRES
jgi:release factor glutamine methyltransferase